MVREELGLADPRLEQTVRVLAASANTRILSVLVQERSKNPREGWMFLSQIAEAVGESPGSVSLAVQKLLPLLEEQRRKGRRYFRATHKIRLILDPF